MKLRPQTTEEKNKSSGGFKERRQQCLDALKNIPTVNIKGKKYSTVNERHKHLLQYFPEARFNEEILFHDADRVIVKVELYISDVIYSVGHAEEFRNSSFINKTSALENGSSSALGRCLAAFGLSGSEYASAEELVNALNNQNTKTVLLHESTLILTDASQSIPLNIAKNLLVLYYQFDLAPLYNYNVDTLQDI